MKSVSSMGRGSTEIYDKEEGSRPASRDGERRKIDKRGEWAHIEADGGVGGRCLRKRFLL